MADDAKQYALDKHKEWHGKIEVVSRDDNGNPGDAVRVAEELLSREGASFLIGTFFIWRWFKAQKAFSEEITA